MLLINVFGGKMGNFLVNGGKPLWGTVSVSGSKNAGLPVIFASLLPRGTSYIYNLADIGDVRVALNILRDFGIEVTREGNRTVINAERAEYKTPNEDKVSKIRASTYLIGSSLSRFGRAELQSFGGCNFSLRPIDLHIKAALAFGAREEGNALVAEKLRPADITFEKVSVGATVNSLIMAANAEGVSRIRGCAKEPHILTLINFLNSCGAKIYNDGDGFTVEGSGALHGGSVRIQGDMIEAGSYLALSLVSGGRVRVVGADESELSPVLAPLKEAGVKFDISPLGATALTKPKKEIKITTAPYPYFPTDLQPIIAPVMANFYGGTITEGVWRGRFGYLSELAKFGVKSVISENQATLFPSQLSPAKVNSTDLRGGFASLICALATEGISSVRGAEMILRGYENPINKLLKLGAEIEYNEN